MNSAETAFIAAYNAGLERRRQEEQSKSLYEWLVKSTNESNAANIAPYQKRADTFTDTMNKNAQSNLETILSGALGGTDEQKQRALSLGSGIESQRVPIVAQLDSAKEMYGTNPYASAALTEIVKKNPSSLLSILPMVQQQEQQRRTGIQTQTKSALGDWFTKQIQSAPDAQTAANIAFAAKQQGIEFPTDLLKFKFPQDKPNYHFSTDQNGNLWQINPNTKEKVNLGPVGQPQKPQFYHTTDQGGNVWQVDPITGQKQNMGQIGQPQREPADKSQQTYDRAINKLQNLEDRHANWVYMHQDKDLEFDETKSPVWGQLKQQREIVDGMSNPKQPQSKQQAPSFDYGQIMNEVTQQLSSRPAGVTKQQAIDKIKQVYGNLGPEMVDKIINDVAWDSFGFSQ